MFFVSIKLRTFKFNYYLILIGFLIPTKELLLILSPVTTKFDVIRDGWGRKKETSIGKETQRERNQRRGKSCRRDIPRETKSGEKSQQNWRFVHPLREITTENNEQLHERKERRFRILEPSISKFVLKQQLGNDFSNLSLFCLELGSSCIPSGAI